MGRKATAGRNAFDRVPPVVSLTVAYLTGYYAGAAAGAGSCAGVGQAAVRGGMTGLWPVYVAGAIATLAAVAVAVSGRFVAETGTVARARPVWVGVIICSFLAIGMGRGLFARQRSRALAWELQGLEARAATAVGVVVGFPAVLPDCVRFPFETYCLGSDERHRRWNGGRPRLLVTVKPVAHVHYGDYLRLKGELAIPTGPRNPGGFDYRAYLSGRGLDGTFRAKSHQVELLDEGFGVPLFSRALGPVRRGISGLVDRNLEGEARSLLRGLLLGDRSLMVPDLREAMAHAGVVHIMAVSGLHVGLVALILACGGRCARLSVRSTELLSLSGVWLYCGMVGLPASACRAASMVTAYLICRRLQRPAVSFGALAAAGFAMAIAFPHWARTPGFQLSFSAAAGVLAFKDTVVRLIERFGRELRPGLREAATLMGASLGAQITSWPLVALHFGRTPLLFLLGNAVAVPLVGLVLTWGLTAVAMSLVSSTLASWALASCLAAAFALSHFCRFVGSIPWASASMPAFSPILIACYFITLAAVICSRGRRRLLAAGALALTVVLICFGLPRPSRGDKLEVAFLDVGHGDACVILAPTGETMLVDAGESARGWDAGRNVITPFLRERGVRVVDRAVISHGDGDHWGGLAYLADHMRIKELVLPVGVPLGPLGELVPVLEARGTTVRWVEAGDTLPPLGDLESVVIHPSRRFEELHGSELGEDLNDRSLVLRVTYGDVVFLMTGDIEEVGEEWLVAGSRFGGEGTVEWPCGSDGVGPIGDGDGLASTYDCDHSVPPGKSDGAVPSGDHRCARPGGAYDGVGLEDSEDSALCDGRGASVPGGTRDGPGSRVYSGRAAPSLRGTPPGGSAGGRHPAPWASPLDCTVIKVPHHGSDTSSSPEFVLRASPLLAVISCGPKERFNLPKPQMLDRYKAQGVLLMMTARDGAVLLRTDGREVFVTPYLRPSEAFELSLPTGAQR